MRALLHTIIKIRLKHSISSKTGSSSKRYEIEVIALHIKTGRERALSQKKARGTE